MITTQMLPLRNNLSENSVSKVLLAKVNCQIVQSIAQRYLGLGVQNGKIHLSNQSYFGSYDSDSIGLGAPKFVNKVVVSTGYESTENGAQSRAHFDFEAGPINALLQNERSYLEKTTHSTVHCVAMGLRLDSCHFLGETLPLASASSSNSVQGVITAGTVYTGYKIRLKITTEDKGSQEKEETGFDGDLPIIRELLEMKLDGNDAKKAFGDKKITRVEIEEESIGSYDLPSFEPDPQSIDSSESVWKHLKKVREDFRLNSSLVENREFSFDLASDVKQLFLSGVEIEKQPKLSASVVEIKDYASHKSSFFDGLVAQIKEHIGESFEEHLMKELRFPIENRNISMSRLLESIEKAFINFPYGNPTSRDGENHTVILGPSGVGKTLLTGYLSGNSIRESKHQGKPVYIYGDEIKAVELPKIGHSRSETVGCHLYGNYLDTAGFGDTGGIEVDIANGASIKLAIDTFLPNRVIIMMPSSYITDARGTKFFDIVESFQKIVILTARNFPYIKFVINPIRVDMDQAQLELDIKSLLNSLIFERDRELELETSKREQAELEGNFLNCFNEHLSKLEETRRDKVFKLQRKIEVIQSALESACFILANFLEGQTRDVLIKWQEGPSHLGLRATDFRMNNFTPNGISKFKIMLTSLALYLNEQFRVLEHTRERIARLSSEKSVSSNEKSLSDLNSEISLLQSEIEQLHNDESLEVDQVLMPEFPITLNSRRMYNPLSWLSSRHYAAKYSFLLPEENRESLQSVQLKPYGGSFLSTAEEFIETGKIDFRPDVPPKEDAVKTCIELLVMRKNSIKTKAILIEKKGALEVLEDQLKSLIADPKRLTIMQESEKLQEDFDRIKDVLSKYGSFAKLMANVARLYHLDTSDDLREKETFSDFIRNFSVNDNINLD